MAAMGFSDSDRCQENRNQELANKVDIPIPAKGKQGLWEWGEGK